MIRRNRTLLLLLIILCLCVSGCATIGAVGTGFFKLFTGTIGFVLKVLNGLADIANKLPRPPGVF